MIRNDDERSGPGHAIRADDLDAVVEEAHERPRERPHEGGARLHGRRPGRVLPSRHRGWWASVRRDTAWHVAMTVPSVSSVTVMA